MAKPRVFVSSTFYDLKHIRSSLEHFIESLGYEAILSEEGNIPYRPDRPLDESCYLEAEHADIFVLIVGGRYGSAVSDEKRSDSTPEKDENNADDFYTSITRREYEKASLNIPTYILIDKNVYAEYFTYLKNKNNNTVYAHVDSTNIFHFIDYIKSKQLNNPIQTFDKHTDIQNWLKEQWAGLFREYLRAKTKNSQISSLENEVQKLSIVNDTLKRYLETLINAQRTTETDSIITEENEKIKEKIYKISLQNNPLLLTVKNHIGMQDKDIIDNICTSKTIKQLLLLFDFPFQSFQDTPDDVRKSIIEGINQIREVYGFSPLIDSTKSYEMEGQD